VKKKTKPCVIAKKAAGKNIARFRSSTDIAGIRRLRVQAALSHANREFFFG
jgi:hypothetical protein